MISFFFFYFNFELDQMLYIYLIYHLNDNSYFVIKFHSIFIWIIGRILWESQFFIPSNFQNVIYPLNLIHFAYTLALYRINDHNPFHQLRWRMSGGAVFELQRSKFSSKEQWRTSHDVGNVTIKFTRVSA